jgi:hypothetical protein
MNVGLVESHTIREIVLLRRQERLNQAGHMTVGDLGKAHRIHATVNNCQEEHQSTVLETLCMITYQQFSVLIYPRAIESFISSVALKIIKVKVVEQDEFRYVEMTYGAKKKVGGKVKDCNINLGDFIANVNLMSPYWDPTTL